MSEDRGSTENQQVVEAFCTACIRIAYIDRAQDACCPVCAAPLWPTISESAEKVD